MPPTKFMIKQAQKHATKRGFKPSDLLDLMEFESNFTPGAVSSANAQGLTQFIPSTAASYGVKYGTSKAAQKTQIKGAAKYLKDLGISKNPADITKALAGYYGAASPYASRLLAQDKYEKYDDPSSVAKGAKKSAIASKLGKTTGTTGKKVSVTTQPAIDNSAARQTAALAFVQQEGKTSADYAAFAESQNALKDVPAQKKSITLPGSSKGKKVESFKDIEGGATGKIGTKKMNDVLGAAKLAEKMGLNVGEHPKYGGVAAGVHATGSYHYSGRAIDVSGDPAKMAKFANILKRKYGSKLAELFWNGANAANVDNGQPVQKGFVSGHTDHVHVAV